jgi:hypothetical protein
MACSDEDRGRSRRPGAEDQGWSHWSDTRWPGDREVGWHRMWSVPCMWRRGARVSWLSLKTKVDGFHRFCLKTSGDGFYGLASKPAAMIFACLASKPVARVFSSLASKLLATVSPGLASKSVVSFLFEPQNQVGGGFPDLGLKIGCFGLVIWATKSL